MKRRQALRQSLAFTGAAISAPLYMSLLQGCAPSGQPEWTSKVLDKDQLLTLIDVAELMFPSGDKPSAAEVHVAECVDLLVTDCRSQDEQTKLKEALNAINQFASTQSKKKFHQLDSDDQGAVLKSLEQEVYSSSGDPKSKYVGLKGLIMMAYFTSEEVMKNQLNYNPLPGRHDACVDLAVDGKVFVDNNV